MLPLQALRGPQQRFSRSGPLPGHEMPKRAETVSGAKAGRPAAHPRFLPTPRPSRPCARLAARPRLPQHQVRAAERGAAPRRAVRGEETQPDPAGPGVTGRTPPLLCHLQNFLIETQEGKLKISATDLEASITSWTTAQVHHPGATSAPARLFSEFVNSLAEGPIEMEIPQGSGVLQSRPRDRSGGRFPGTPW